MPRRGGERTRLSPDGRTILTVQGIRAFAYGLGSVVIGISLADASLSGPEVGLVLAAMLAGSAAASLALGRFGDRIGRRRAYVGLLVGMAAAGTVFAVTSSTLALVLAALSGTLSTEVVESGPFNALEQAMLARESAPRGRTRVFALYGTVATIAGSLGALAAGAAQLTDPRHLLFAYPAAALAASAVATRLSSAVEPDGKPERGPAPPLHRSRAVVVRLCGLFALDSFGGGFVTQTLISYVFVRKFGASPEALGALFFCVGLLQAVSFHAAVRLADRIGLLRTMVFTHLPSNLLLAAIAFAPNLETAVALLLLRFALSQMDVPTRQAYVAAVVDPSERTAAAAYTNAARYAVRPLAPLVAGPLLAVGLGAPFLVGGTIKAAYDVGLYALMQATPVDSEGL